MAAFKEYADYDALGLGELIAKKQVTSAGSPGRRDRAHRGRQSPHQCRRAEGL